MTQAMVDAAPRCVWDIPLALGEGPLWVAHERALYFVDIIGKAIHRWDDRGTRRSWDAPAEPGFIAPFADGGFICGLRGGLYRFDPASGGFTLLCAVERDLPHHRLNDGFVDAGGRLWFGTMHEDARTPGGALYTLEHDGRLRKHDRDYIVTNGPVMSPDGTTFYHTDSERQVVFAFDHAEGRLFNKRPFITFSGEVFPDGMAVDSHGHLWIALFNGWRVERYTPHGEKVGEIGFPCANLTKPAFGGDDLKTLFVTSARIGQDAEQLERQPLAGGLFAVDVAVAGLACHTARLASST